MKKNLIFIVSLLLSLSVHVIFFSLTFKDTSKQEKPKKITYLDIQKKKSLKNEKKPDFLPDFLSDEDMNLSKKEPIEKEQKKKPEKIPTVKKQIPKPMTKKSVPAEKKSDEVKENLIVKKDIQQTPIIEKAPDLPQNTPKNNSIKESNADLDRKTLSKNQLENILNPKDIINDIVSKNPEGSKEGEDEVNFKSMKFKYSSYFHKFKIRLYNVWTYPDSSILKGEEGTVRIKFSILKDGTITGIKVIRSSGYSDLDRSAINALKNMGKVPLSDSFDINVLNVDGYFSYNLGYVGRFIE